MKPEGSTYAGARSDHRIPGKAEFEHIIKLVAIKKKVFIKKTNMRQIRSARKTLEQFPISQVKRGET